MTGSKPKITSIFDLALIFKTALKKHKAQIYIGFDYAIRVVLL